MHTKQQDIARPRLATIVFSYWRQVREWRVYAMLLVLLANLFGSASLSLWINRLVGSTTDALLTMKWQVIWPVLAASALAGVSLGAVVVISVSVQNFLELRWRTWLTEKFQHEWLAAHAFYDIEREGQLSNADQRIAEDVKMFTHDTLNLSLNFLSVVVSMATYGYVLWDLSRVIQVQIGGATFAIHGFMVFVAVVYNVCSLALTHWVGKRLVGLNNERQTVEADFRFGAMQVRENAEQIAFYGGAPIENARLNMRFARIRHNTRALIIRRAKVQLTNFTFGHLFDGLPTLAALPLYLTGQITLGGMTRAAAAYRMLSGTLSFFSQAYEGFASWIALANRLRDLEWAINKARLRGNGFALERQPRAELVTGPLTILDPLERPLTHLAPLRIAPGERWIVRGPSGVGKSTLLRVLAGLWPYGAGAVALPQRATMMFVPQRSYLPTGSFKEALCYPHPADRFDDERCRRALALCALDGSISDIGEYDNWQKRLSGGEQQRVAFARVLLQAPDFVFLDEATSALDPGLETLLYSTLVQSLPDASIVSVAHRPELARFHDHVLELEPARGRVHAPDPAPASAS